jgi:dTDP-4-amino-4,6-dideoxygalactose transaminase
MSSSADLDRHRPALLGGKPVRDHDRYLVFGKPSLTEEDIAEVVATLRSGWIGTGPKVSRFEKAFSEYIGVPHAVAISSCTAALRLAMLALGVGPGDEVITTPLTFCATVNSILHSGAVPVLADCRREDMNLDPAEVARKITPRTRAILPVHFGGRLCDMEAIMAIARKHGVFVLEDCAHAIETTGPGGRKAGAWGDMAAFSFYATKNVTTAEGGMVVTADKKAADRIRILALHGLTRDAWKRYSDDGYKHYDIIELGYKSNLTDLQASLGLGQLARVESNLEKRERIWARYDEAFADLPVERPAPVAPGTRHARHLYTLLVTEKSGIGRDALLGALHAEGIGSGVHYLPITAYTYYRETLGLRPGDFPNAESIGTRTVSLPLSPAMTDEDVDDVIAAVRKILAWRGW